MLKRISIILIVFLFLVSCNSKKNNKNCNVSYDINDLVSAIDENNINIIQEALGSGFNINTTMGADNITLLDYAIDKNREHIAILLIEKGIDINHIDNNGLATFSKAIGNMSQILLAILLFESLYAQINTAKIVPNKTDKNDTLIVSKIPSINSL